MRLTQCGKSIRNILCGDLWAIGSDDDNFIGSIFESFGEGALKFLTKIAFTLRLRLPILPEPMLDFIARFIGCESDFNMIEWSQCTAGYLDERLINRAGFGGTNIDCEPGFHGSFSWRFHKENGEAAFELGFGFIQFKFAC